MDKESFYNYISKYLSLIGLYLNKKEAKDFNIDNKELSFFLRLSKSHSLTAALYKVMLDTKANIPQEELKKLEECYYANVRKDVLFDKERKALYKEMNDNQIDFLPLKGLVIKDYYIDPYTREYADNDILFTSKDKVIRDFFIKRGYTVKLYKRSKHDVYMKKPFFNFEMHRALFMAREDNKKNVIYFKDYMNKAQIKEGYEHYLNKEDFYIYFTAHTYKHFHASGCGIRTLIDYYLYLKNNELDFIYINKELEKLDLLDFSNQITSLSKKIFDNEELTNEEKEMLLYIASSGTYGTLENSVKKGVEEKGKFKYFMSRIFPPMSFYKTNYPWAYRTIILIPIAWLCRFFRILFKNPRRAAKELKMISKSKDKKTTD